MGDTTKEKELVRKRNMKSFSDFTFDTYVSLFLYLFGTCIKNDDTLLLGVCNEIKILYAFHKISLNKIFFMTTESAR